MKNQESQPEETVTMNRVFKRIKKILSRIVDFLAWLGAKSPWGDE